MQKKNFRKIDLIVISVVILTFIFGCSKKNAITENITPPSISNVQVINIATSQATVTWVTDEPATSQIDYGPSTYYYSGVFNSKFVDNHSITLTNLSPSTVYHFQISGTTISGSFLTDVDRTFLTLNTQ